MSTLQELLLSIATGGHESFRVHRRRDALTGETIDVVRMPGEHPGLWEELQTTIARLARMGRSAGGTAGKAAESPVPYHAKASEAAHRLQNTVTTWARAVAEENDHLTLSATTVPAAARWLAALPTILAEHPAAGEMHAAILQCVKSAKWVIDRAPDKIYAGPCQEPLDETGTELCQGQLYAKREDDSDKAEPFVTCRDCRTRHDVAVRREWLARQLDDQLVTAAEAAPVLAFLTGKKITGNNIAAWKRDGRVTVHAGRWPYRFGDLHSLARDMKTRKKEGSAA